MQRDFGCMNVTGLCEDASNIDWSTLFISSSVDQKVDIFTTKLVELYDHHAPVRAVKVKHFPAPWLTDEIKSLMNKKVTAKSKFKRHANDANRERYVSIRNHCNKVCRNANRQHIHNSVQNGDASKVWNFLRSLRVGKTQQESVLKDLDINAMNNHFTASSNFDRTTKLKTLD